jgi:hypothetical protein
MRPLNGERLLEAWERGARQTDLIRPLLLLAVSRPERTWEELMSLSIVERDIELLRLRRMTFGDALRGCVPCTVCATRVEFEISVTSMVNRMEALRPPRESIWQTGRYSFSLRPVTTRDLAAVSSLAEGRRSLLALCVSTGAPDNEAALVECEDSIVEQFNRLNEGAETQFALICPACGALDRVDLDVARFLWAEVRHAAIATLREVHELASAYGWTEGSILEMNSTRRGLYLEMAHA